MRQQLRHSAINAACDEDDDDDLPLRSFLSTDTSAGKSALRKREIRVQWPGGTQRPMRMMATTSKAESKMQPRDQEHMTALCNKCSDKGQRNTTQQKQAAHSSSSYRPPWVNQDGQLTAMHCALSMSKTTTAKRSKHATCTLCAFDREK